MILASLLFAAHAFAAPDAHPFNQQLLPATPLKLSPHVWYIQGYPNCAIVVGSKSTLVVDTGLGRKNGETVAKAAHKLAPKNKLFVTSTHFHPEHAAGILGFPTNAILLRNRTQSDEMTGHGEEMIHTFASRNEFYKSLLTGEQLRSPDVVFEKELAIDLGGVSARILEVGPAHTKGDAVVFVETDKTLISGDVVQNKVEPAIYKQGGSLTTWIAAVEQIEKLGAEHVLPDHSPAGDGTLVGAEKALLTELRSAALALKKQGLTAEAATPKLKEVFEKAHPDVAPADMGEVVRATFAE